LPAIKTFITKHNQHTIMPIKGDVADKRIVVKDKVWRDIHQLREPGQTYGDVVEFLVAEHNQRLISSPPIVQTQTGASQ
jgi:dTDP-4-dehydrorhamnose 3,5-epimerase-like enzyme